MTGAVVRPGHQGDPGCTYIPAGDGPDRCDQAATWHLIASGMQTAPLTAVLGAAADELMMFQACDAHLAAVALTIPRAQMVLLDFHAFGAVCGMPDARWVFCAHDDDGHRTCRWVLSDGVDAGAAMAQVAP